MTTCMVMAPVTPVTRQFLEDMEQRVFKTVEDVYAHFEKYYKGVPIKTYTLSEFVDACNDQEIILDASWLTSVMVNKPFWHKTEEKED